MALRMCEVNVLIWPHADKKVLYEQKCTKPVSDLWLANGHTSICSWRLVGNWTMLLWRS